MKVCTEKASYCKNEFMSICTAGSVEEQKNCRFYKPSSHSDKCMYYILDKYCDCVEAQVAAEEKSAPEIL